MKKMKLFLLAAMIFGAGSAFTTVKTTDPLWVKGPGGIGFILESDAQQDYGAYCDGVTAEDCTYLDNAGTPDPDALPGRYFYPNP